MQSLQDSTSYEWPAVAVALINMIGSVLMSWMREQTNQHRQVHNGLPVRDLDKTVLRRLRTLHQSRARKISQARLSKIHVGTAKPQ
jgi:hypothetical protein